MGKKKQAQNKAETAALPERKLEWITQRAYQLFEQRGFEHGHDVEDWLQAEAEAAAMDKDH